MSAPLSSTQAVLLVARREFSTQVRSRSFVIGLIFTLVLFAGGFLLSQFIGGQNAGNTLGVTSETASLEPALQASATAAGKTLEIRTVDEVDGRAAGRRGGARRPAHRWPRRLPAASARTRWTTPCRRS